MLASPLLSNFPKKKRYFAFVEFSLSCYWCHLMLLPVNPRKSLMRRDFRQADLLARR